jgi:Leucine-rich repeat (LRR) protein
MKNFVYDEEVEGVNIKFYNNGKTIYVNLKNIEQCIYVSDKYQIYDFSLDSYEGFDGADLNFLKRFKHVQCLQLRSATIQDISYIYQLEGIEEIEISIVGKIEKLDLSKFPSLKRLYCGSRYIKNLTTCTTLESLGMVFLKKYPLYSLEELAALVNLKGLSLGGSQIQSLKGIEAFKKLTFLYVWQNRQLADITDLVSLKDTLEELEFDKNKLIKSYEPIGSLKKLHDLRLSDCGQIASLGFVRDMPALVAISFVDSNILDGDLSVFLDKRFEHVGFMDKRHYNLKSDYVEAYIKSQE